MAFTRGRYGVEYHHRETETHHLRGFVIIVIVFVVVAFACFRISKWWTNRKPVIKDDPITTEGPKPDAPIGFTNATPSRPRPMPTNHMVAVATGENQSTNRPALPPPKPSPTVPPAMRSLVRQLLDTMEMRPQTDRTQIMRYTDAELRGNTANAADAIKRLYDRPSMADVRDPLMRRLGDLNLETLTNLQDRANGRSTAWTKTVIVHRGDGLERLAREHRNTQVALRRLNPKVKWEKLKPGDQVTVLDFPNANLVIHKQTGIADLSLRNEKFFRRYYFTTAKDAACAVYPITAEPGDTMSARFRKLGVKVSYPDRAELELFMGPGARIVVAEQ